MAKHGRHRRHSGPHACHSRYLIQVTGYRERERERELDIRSVPPLPWNLHCFLVQFSCVIVTKCCYKFPYDICGDVILFVAAVWWSSCFHRVPRHVCVFVCVCVQQLTRVFLVTAGVWLL